MNLTILKYLRNIQSLSWNYKTKQREEHEVEIVFGGIAFVVLFAAWVIIPTIVKKRHAVKVEEDITEA
jgi:hypothetical protein